MKTRMAFIMSGLMVGLIFSCLLVRITSLERQVAKQQEQIAVMRESAGFAREAFDTLPQPHADFLFFTHSYRIVRPTPETQQRVPCPCLLSVPLPAYRGGTESVKDLDAEIQMLEIVSKER